MGFTFLETMTWYCNYWMRLYSTFLFLKIQFIFMSMTSTCFIYLFSFFLSFFFFLQLIHKHVGVHLYSRAWACIHFSLLMIWFIYIYGSEFISGLGREGGKKFKELNIVTNVSWLLCVYNTLVHVRNVLSIYNLLWCIWAVSCLFKDWGSL